MLHTAAAEEMLTTAPEPGSPTYGTSLLDRLGVTNTYSSEDVAYPETTLADAARRRPDVVLAPSEPYPFGERHRGEREDADPARLVDGKDLLWWGTRTTAALARLAGAVGD